VGARRGNPVPRAELAAGETVLDLGSGGGIDTILAAHDVGPTGRAIGIDLLDEILERASANAAEAGVGGWTLPPQILTSDAAWAG
jgi:arsenite methyltransferase